MIVQEFGAGHAREQDRRVPREVGDVFDELQELRLGPLQVVDREDQRPMGGELFQQHPNAQNVSSGAAAPTDTDRLPDQLRDPAGVLARPRERRELRRAASGLSASLRSAISISASASG